MVAVLSKNKKPLMPCTEKRARLLLQRGRARIHKVTPFEIRLVDRRVNDAAFQPITLKLDPGSKETGVALARVSEDGLHALVLAELQHRGQQIKRSLGHRSDFRRRRRGKNLRYREKRYDNRRTAKGWLAPSIQHRVDSTMCRVKRAGKSFPVTSMSMELNRFDMQLMQNPDISGVQYQQGTLAGFEVKEYLLEKFGHKCVYCNAQDVPLEVEHIVAKANGGTNRISNLTLSCVPCNKDKGKMNIRDFLKKRPELLAKILAQLKTPLNDAAAVNSTRFALHAKLTTAGLPVETGSGGKTKWNRTRFSIHKSHALDALCVGDVVAVHDWQIPTLQIKCTGRGSYKRTRLDPFGFPRGYLTRERSIFGFQTGDIVRAFVPNGKKAGTYVGRVAVRASGSFNIQTSMGTVEGISYKYCSRVQRADGYGYSQKSNYEGGQE